jgi:hypothetical protein
VRRDRALDLLREVAAGRRAPEEALGWLAAPASEPVDIDGATVATLDAQRALRQGIPEVVYGEGKTPAQCVAIAERLAGTGDGFLVTRCSAEARDVLTARFPEAVASVLGRTVRLAPAVAMPTVAGPVCVVTAGTADLPVAEECAETLLALGLATERLTDVGVAGLHRLLARTDVLARAAVTIVVAGMDGALPSVVGGLARGPVIAVPTSVGYGAAFGGLAPLLTMLNSCAAGVTVVNIDNGFGAAMAAYRILAVGRAGEAQPNYLPGNGLRAHGSTGG